MNTRNTKFSAAILLCNTLCAVLIIVSLALGNTPAHADEGISEAKIKELRDKLDAKNNVDLVLKAKELGVVD